MFALGAMLLAFFFAPALEGKFAPWKKGGSEVVSTGLIIRAISGDFDCRNAICLRSVGPMTESESDGVDVRGFCDFCVPNTSFQRTLTRGGFGQLNPVR